jgi:hypothetical protein
MSGAEAMAAALVIIALVAGPIGRAIARRIGGQSGAPSESETARIAELEQRLQDVETVPARMAELEERMDFAERLLAQHSGESERALPSRSADG